jgi:hypothetical protein
MCGSQHQAVTEHVKYSCVWRFTTANEQGISSVHEYITQYEELGQLEDNKLDEIQNTPLDALYSIQPFVGQDIMYADLNPGTKSDIRTAFGGTNEYTRKADAMGETRGEERLSELMWHICSQYSVGAQPGRESVANAIYSHLSSTSVSFDDYLCTQETDISGSVFENVFFSHVYRWPSSGRSDLDEADIEFGKTEFINELETIKPNLLIIACRDAWSVIRTEYETKIEVHEYGSSTGTITGSYGHGTDSDIGGIYEIPHSIVLTVPHPSGRTWHPNQNMDDLEELVAKCRTYL